MKKIIFTILIVQFSFLIANANETNTPEPYHTACIGNDTISVGYPFYTYYMDSRCDMLYTASEIIAAGGHWGIIQNIGFYIISVGSPPMKGFNLRIQFTTATTLYFFISSGWTTVYTSPSFQFNGTGLQIINFINPIAWDGTSNIAIEICFNNDAWSTNTMIRASSAPGKTIHQYGDLPEGDGCDYNIGTIKANRPNICFNGVISGTNDPTINIPSEYSLSQNFPNPFNPVAIIKYGLPKRCDVSLKVFDVLGKEVAVLVNQRQEAGTYQVDWDGSQYPSGVYYYRIEAGDFVKSKSMILIK